MTIEEKKERASKAITAIAEILSDAIQESGSIPNGHLYAMVMDKVPLHIYNSIIGTLKKKGKVSESGHLLTWVG